MSMRALISVSLFCVATGVHADEFLFAKSCGLKGNLTQRIADCSAQFGELATKKFPANDPLEPNRTFDWSLVTRTEEAAQVWYDATTKLVWSDTASDDYIFSRSLKFCQDARQGVNVKGVDQLSLTGKNRLSFNLPTKSEFRAALAHGALAVLPNWRPDEGIFWSSSAGQKFEVCSSTYHQGYYSGSRTAPTWNHGYYTYSCEPAEFMDVLSIKNNAPEYNSRTLWFNHTGAIKCVARADEK